MKLSLLRHRGQGLVEFALVLPLFVLIIAGIFDLGLAVYSQNAISNAARAGSRVAIVDQSPDAIRAAAIGGAVGVPLADADVAPTFGCVDKIGCLAKVAITYDYEPVVPVIEFLVGDISLTTYSEMPIERIFVSPGS